MVDGTAAAPAVAAIDVGTQSVRLLISQAGRDRLRLATVTHLGQGVRQSGRFDPARLDRTLEVLSGYRGLLETHGVTRARAVATEGVRLAADPDSFLIAASHHLGLAVELIGSDEEGRLAFAGAAAGLGAGPGPLVTVDLGGGSCEFAVGDTSCEAVFSAPIGASLLTETYLPSDPPRPEELTAALSIVAAHLDDVSRGLPQLAEGPTFVGLGGTFTTMAAVEIGLQPYDRDAIHRFELTREAAEDVFRTMVTEPLADRVHNPGLPEARARTILGGSCAVVAIMRYFGLERVVVSEDDLLDGIAAALAGTH